ncbi:MAG: hypothetical protein R3E54_13370 [Halioglobus sp.]
MLLEKLHAVVCKIFRRHQRLKARTVTGTLNGFQGLAGSVAPTPASALSIEIRMQNEAV